MEKLPLVEVAWVDAWAESDALLINALSDMNPVIRHHGGFLAYQDDDTIILCGDYYKTPNGDWVATERFILPRCMMRGDIIYKDNPFRVND